MAINLESITSTLQQLEEKIKQEIWKPLTLTIETVPYWLELLTSTLGKLALGTGTVAASVFAFPSYSIMTQSEELLNLAIHMYDWFRYGIVSSAVNVNDFAQQVVNNVWNYINTNVGKIESIAQQAVQAPQVAVPSQIAQVANTAQQATQAIQTTVPAQTAQVSQVAQQAPQQIQSTISTVANAIATLGTGAYATAQGTISSTAQQYTPYVAGLFETVEEQLFDQADWTLHYTGGVVNQEMSFLATLAGVLGVVSTIVNIIAQLHALSQAHQIQQQTTQFYNTVQYSLGSLASSIANLPGNLFNAITSPLINALSNIGQYLNNSINAVSNAINTQTQSLVQAQTLSTQAVTESILGSAQAVAGTLAQAANTVGSVINQGLRLLTGTVGLGEAAVVQAINNQTLTQVATAAKFAQEVDRVISQAAYNVNVQLHDVSLTIERVNNDIAKAIREHYAKVEEISKPFQDALKEFEEAPSPDLADKCTSLVREAQQYAPELASAIASITSLPNLVKTITGVLMIKDVFAELKAATWQPVMEKLRQQVSKRVRENLISDGDILEAVQRGILPDNLAREYFARKGYDDTQINALLKLIETFLSADALAEAYYRGIISEYDYLNRLKKLGYSEESARILIKLKEALLSAGDIVTLYLRGAITEQDAEERLHKLGYPRGMLKTLVILRTQYATPSELANALRKGYIDKEYVKKVMKAYGFSDETIDILFKLTKPLPGVTDVTDAYHRGFIDENEMTKYLKEQGWEDKEIELIKKLMWRIPPLNDIIRMAVRECFTPEIAEKFGQYEDVPNEFLKYAKQQGLDEFWAKAYWAAHWELPSISMGFEMFHREVITKDELMLLLRAQDVMPFWRDKLLQISYEPLTRIDLRRIWELGLIDEQELERRLRHLGYSPDDAKLMVEYYKVEKEYSKLAQQAQGLELAKNEVLKAYSLGVISRTEAIERLKDLHYQEEEAELYVMIEDVKKQTSLKERKIKNAIKAYTQNKITYDRLVIELTQLGLTGSELKEALDEAELTKKESVRQLTKEDILNMLRYKIIDANKAHERLVSMGYSDEDAMLLVALANKRGG